MTLEYDPTPSDRYPHGYWCAEIKSGKADAIGLTPLDALAALVIALEEAGDA